MKKKNLKSLLSVKMFCFDFANVFKVQYAEIVVWFLFLCLFFVCLFLQLEYLSFTNYLFFNDFIQKN